MVSSISSSVATLAVPTKAPANDPVAKTQLAGADRAMNLLMKDTTLLSTLASNSSTYVPPSSGQIFSLLWGIMNPDGGSEITKSGLEKAVRIEGGSTSDADALYGEISKKTGGANTGIPSLAGVTAGDFATNTYLTTVLMNNMSSEADAVNQQRIQDQVNALSASANILLYMFGGGSSGGSLNIFS